jgi:hypothetical protein
LPAASLLHANTRFAFSFAIPIVAIAPDLNFKKSVSIPSEVFDLKINLLEVKQGSSN